MELIGKLAQATDLSRVLVVGCGSGGTTVHLAETTGAAVCGIDIAVESIRTAGELASKSSASVKLHWLVGDAHALPLTRGGFDLVITEFMAFLLRRSAFEGFFQALKPGGLLALAELVKDENVSSEADAKIRAAEQTYSDVLGYEFHIPLVTQYLEWLAGAGFEQVRVVERFSEPSLREKIRNVGGWRNVFRITRVLLRLMWKSPTLRRMFLHVGSVKRVLYQNRATARYVFQAVLAGRKPSEVL